MEPIGPVHLLSKGRIMPKECEAEEEQEDENDPFSHTKMVLDNLAKDFEDTENNK